MKNLLKISLLSLIISFVCIACQKVEFEIDDVPRCFKKKVRNDDLTRIQKLEVDAEVFYLLYQDSCGDCFNELYDENCDYVSAPSGGITGAGDGNCPTWNGVVVTTLAWEKD